MTATTAVSADTYPRQRGVDALHYVFRLRLLVDATSEIDGTATTIFRMKQDDVREIGLDLASRSADGRGMVVSRVVTMSR